jgi:hypothetical protein
VTRLLALGFLAACGADDVMMMVDRHAPGTCDSIWTANGFDQCETGCVDSAIALNATGASCDAKTVGGNAVFCQKTFVFAGVTGCCASQAPSLFFADCQ